jgi:hypothetical protein
MIAQFVPAQTLFGALGKRRLLAFCPQNHFPEL